MRLRPLALTLLALGTAAQAAEVGAYYYPWYGSFPGGHSWLQTLRDHLVPKQGPLIGDYSSRDATTIASQIGQSHRANIDFWAMSWWGPNSAEDNTIRNSILTNPRASELQYAVHYESTGRLGTFDNPSYASLTPDFEYLAQNYFTNPNYLRIDGRPVVFIYLTRAYFNTAASRTAVANLRQDLLTKFGTDPYLVGDDVFTSGVDTTRAKLWDAITDFDVYGTALQSHGSTTTAVSALNSIYRSARTTAHSLGVGFIPTASPGFNDRGVRTGHPAAPRYLTNVAGATEGSLFSRILSQAAVPNADPAADRIVMVNSFNEWHEDTQVEAAKDAPPTTTDDSGMQTYTQGYSYPGYGSLYLDLLHQATLLPGDANDDGLVDFKDLLILAQNYGRRGTSMIGDFNGDGSVGFDDVLILAQALEASASPAASAVPEPAGGLLVCAGAVLIGTRRRKKGP